MRKVEKNFIKNIEDGGCRIIGTYQGATVAVNLECPCGNLFTRTPQTVKKSIAKGSSILCEKCRYLESAMKRRKDNSEVDIILNSISSRCMSKYKNINTKMKFVCECGAEYERTFEMVERSLKKTGDSVCISCSRGDREPPNKLDIETISKICTDNGAILLSERYEMNKSPLSFIGSCGHPFIRRWNDVDKSISIYGKILCPSCGRAENRVIVKTSIGEDEVSAFVESLGFEVERNKRPSWANGLEIDIQIKGTNIAIEYNGEYWHSEESGKGRNYHSVKNKCAEKEGINLLQIFETEWKFKKDIMKSIISSKLNRTKRIYARKTLFKKISPFEASSFFNRTHRQGGNGSTIMSYGLFVSDKIVAAISFKKPRFGSGHDIELYRYSSELETTVVGGLSKLLKNFLKTTKYKSIVSYADLRFTLPIASAYSKVGFSLIRESSPGYYYFKQGGTLENRMSYQKKKLEKKLKTFDEKKTEYENMRDNGYHRIWDCGTAVFELKEL